MELAHGDLSHTHTAKGAPLALLVRRWRFWEDDALGQGTIAIALEAEGVILVGAPGEELGGALALDGVDAVDRGVVEVKGGQTYMTSRFKETTETKRRTRTLVVLYAQIDVRMRYEGSGCVEVGVVQSAMEGRPAALGVLYIDVDGRTAEEGDEVVPSAGLGTRGCEVDDGLAASVEAIDERRQGFCARRLRGRRSGREEPLVSGKVSLTIAVGERPGDGGHAREGTS